MKINVLFKTNNKLGQFISLIFTLSNITHQTEFNATLAWKLLNVIEKLQLTTKCSVV